MARAFNGTNQYLQGSSNFDGTTVSKGTVQLWFRPSAYDNNVRLLIHWGQTGSGANAGEMWLDPCTNNYGGGYVSLSSYGSTGQYNDLGINRPNSAATGAWQHWVWLVDWTKSTNELDSIYINGALQTEVGRNANVNNSNNFGNFPMYLMTWDGTSNFLSGAIGEFALWTSLLTSTEIASLYNSAAGRLATEVSSGTLAYYNQIRGQTSPEPPTVGGSSLTVNGGAAYEASFLDNLYGPAPDYTWLRYAR